MVRAVPRTRTDASMPACAFPPHVCRQRTHLLRVKLCREDGQAVAALRRRHELAPALVHVRRQHRHARRQGRGGRECRGRHALRVQVHRDRLRRERREHVRRRGTPQARRRRGGREVERQAYVLRIEGRQDRPLVVREVRQQDFVTEARAPQGNGLARRPRGHDLVEDDARRPAVRRQRGGPRRVRWAEEVHAAARQYKAVQTLHEQTEVRRLHEPRDRYDAGARRFNPLRVSSRMNARRRVSAQPNTKVASFASVGQCCLF